MRHSVRDQCNDKSGLSCHTTSQQSSDSELSKSSAPSSVYSHHSTKFHHQTDNSIFTKAQDSPPLTLDTTYSSSETNICSDEDAEAINDDQPDDNDNDDNDDDDAYPPFLELQNRVITTEIRATNPSNFAEYFPSSKILSIYHDILSSDNNMNLRVDTEDLYHKGVVQLFHFRIHDLESRRFSLRRYERASGREVCKTARKYATNAAVLSRSVSTALAHMKLSSSPSTFLQKLRPDTRSHEACSTLSSPSSDSKQVPTNVIRLDFSNYAQVELRCRGSTRLGKRYEYEYWGHEYVWKRVCKREAKHKRISYHLTRMGHASALAYIVPESQNQWQQYQELKAGNWIPPCSMWIAEAAVAEGSSDVADVIVATGLVTLVDDNIRRSSESSSSSKPQFPFSKPIYEPLIPCQAGE